jgi:hypothetical protein
LIGYLATASSGFLGAGSDLVANRMYTHRYDRFRGFLERIPPNSPALLVLLENCWALSLPTEQVERVQMEFGGIGVSVVREAIEPDSSVVLAQGWVPPETLLDLGADVALDLAIAEHVDTSGSFDTPRW